MRGKNWIYNDEKWPEFYWSNSKLNPVLQRIRGKIENWIQRRNHFQDMRIVGGYDANSYALHLCESGVSTSKIEDVNVDRKQLYRSIRHQIKKVDVLQGEVRADEDGLVNMIIDANHYYREPLTVERLCQWHQWLFTENKNKSKKDQLDVVGQWRECPMTVGNYEAPPPDRVPVEMEKFLDWFNDETDETDSILKAAQAHLWFEKIHPFEDGNRRIGRAIMDMMLGRAGDDNILDVFHSMTKEISENLFNKDKKPGYYPMLGQHDYKDQLDITGWMKWFLDRLEDSMDHVKEIDSQRDGRIKVYMYSQNFGLRESQLQVIGRMLNLDQDIEDEWEGNLTISDYIKITQEKRPTASVHIKKLVDTGILKSNQQHSKKSASYSLITWKEIVESDKKRQKPIKYLRRRPIAYS